MDGALEVRLSVAEGGVTPRAYTSALQDLTLSLEELDRVAEPDRRERAAWFISDTSWRTAGPIVRLRPDLRGRTRSTADLLRPGRVLVGGVRSLQTSPEIPRDFTESVVNRIAAVSRLTLQPATGLRSVDVVALDGDQAPAGINEAVDENAKQALSPVSLAYGSIVGTLDVINGRTKKTRIGLVSEDGQPITCVVDRLDRELYLSAFNSRVLVAGLVRRNGSGQIIRIDADSLEVMPPREVLAVDGLRGLLRNPRNLSVAEIIEEQRGQH